MFIQVEPMKGTVFDFPNFCPPYLVKATWYIYFRHSSDICCENEISLKI